MRFLLRTDNDFSLLILRLGLAFAMFPHGAQKALGWWGGNGIDGTIEWFGTLGFDPWMGYCAIAAEFLGSIALALGLLGRLAALGIGATMVGAAWKMKLADGNFMGWWIEDGMGLEGGFHILAVAIALAILCRGSGALSLDRAFSKPVETPIP
ncbi:MAG: DoxX family protein [Planctomycetota bacterium]|jgi:putative oxidoreductase